MVIENVEEKYSNGSDLWVVWVTLLFLLCLGSW